MINIFALLYKCPNTLHLALAFSVFSWVLACVWKTTFQFQLPFSNWYAWSHTEKFGPCCPLRVCHFLVPTFKLSGNRAFTVSHYFLSYKRGDIWDPIECIPEKLTFTCIRIWFVNKVHPKYAVTRCESDSNRIKFQPNWTANGIYRIPR